MKEEKYIAKLIIKDLDNLTITEKGNLVSWLGRTLKTVNRGLLKGKVAKTYTLRLMK
jgi:hypothetical protein